MAVAWNTLAKAAPNADTVAVVIATPAQRFSNISDSVLADMIGDQDHTVKAEEAHLADLKAEAKRRKLETATGSRWGITVTAQESRRLDTKALGELLATRSPRITRPRSVRRCESRACSSSAPLIRTRVFAPDAGQKMRCAKALAHFFLAATRCKTPYIGFASPQNRQFHNIGECKNAKWMQTFCIG